MGPTLHDVARLAGVSIKTVSNVIHDYPYVKNETRARVQDAIETLGYQPNLSARGLRSGRTGMIGLAVPALRENYFAELADAVIRAAEARGLGVIVEQTSGERETELRVLSGSRPRFLDGLLFSPVALGQDDAPLLEASQPVVLLGERIFGGPTDHVAMHNTSSSRAAVEHLIGIGRTRIAVVGASSGDTATNSSTLRLRGYRQALEGAGIPFDPALVRECVRWNRDGGAETTHRLIRDGVPFDAVFALNDSLGLGVLRALREEDVRVPDDVAVIGFDNIDEARFSVPSMSSVETRREEIAAAAVDLLLDRINEKGPRAAPRLVQPDFRIIARESTGASASGGTGRSPVGASQAL